MSVFGNPYGFRTLFFKECRRFTAVLGQTVGAPVITALLYLLVFAQAMSGRTPVYEGVSYSAFLVPGLIMMTVIQNAFANTSSSLIQSKVMGNLVFVRLAPIGAVEWFVAYVGAALVRCLLVAGAMHLLGMPAAPFWGMLAFLLNFVLYLGPIVLGVTLLVTGLVVFDGAIAVAPAALYLAMNATEGQFVTPSLVGQQISVNPLLVFLSLVFWLWLWGPIGGIVAIPLMIWVIAIVEATLGQTISSGIPGNLRPKRLAARAE